MAEAMSDEEVGKIVQTLRASYKQGKTRTKEARVRYLNAVLRMMKEHREDMYAALWKDLRKARQEAQNGEMDFVVNEANYFLVHMDSIVKPQNVNDGSLLLLGKQAYIQRDPYGLCLIIGAWNYPLHLALLPLVGAIGAGNVAIVKPSELCLATAELLATILPKYLDQDCFRVINGGVETTQAVLRQRFDHILYTGSATVGKIVLRAAAEHLTPTTLELGGKSPVFIDRSANISVAAKRVAWAKTMNCGQVCIAPDYVMCPSAYKDRFVREAYAHMKSFYGGDFKKSPDYGRIVNERHFERLCKLISSQEEKILFGGETDREDKFIAPTIIEADFDDPIMEEEIFGPILAVLTVESADEAINYLSTREKPLTVHVFTNDREVQDRFITETSSGSLLINDLLIQSPASVLPFGGVGASGMGSYHGEHSLNAYTHRKSCIIDARPGLSDLTVGIRYPPYSNMKTALISLSTRTLSPIDRRFLFLVKLGLVAILIAVAIKVIL